MVHRKFSVRELGLGTAFILLMLGIITFSLLYPLLKSYDAAQTPRSPRFIADGVGTAEHLGKVLFREYLLPFEVTSILILIAIIGVVVLAKKPRQS